MTRRHGRSRLGALAAPTVFSILAAGFYLASAEPAVPKVLADVSAPAPLAGEPVAQSAVSFPPVVETLATVAVEQLAPEAAPAPAPAPEPESAPEPEPCADALAAVAAAGLPLPAGVGYRCPSTQFAHHGTACWDAWPCPGSSFIAINLDLGAGATPEYMRHVVAHEICHILDFRDRGWSTEAHADACAAGYGF